MEGAWQPAVVNPPARRPGVPNEVWYRMSRALCYRDPVLDEPGCGCQTDRRGSYRHEGACRALL